MTLWTPTKKMTTNSLFYDYLESPFRQSNAGPRDITHIYAYRPNREDGGALLSHYFYHHRPYTNTLPYLVYILCAPIGGVLLLSTISTPLILLLPIDNSCAQFSGEALLFNASCTNTLSIIPYCILSPDCREALLFRTIWNKPLLLPSMYVYVSCAPSSTNKEIYLSLEYLVSRPSPNHSIDAYWRVLGYPESKPTITYWYTQGVSGHIAYNPLLHPSSLAETPPDAYAVDLSEDNKKTILTVGYSTASNLWLFKCVRLHSHYTNNNTPTNNTFIKPYAYKDQNESFIYSPALPVVREKISGDSRK